jgi:hypothetical protein
VLLALVGLLLGIAAFDESWLRPALLVAFVSKGAFLTLFAITGPHGAPMRRVAIADVGAPIVLAAVIAARLRWRCGQLEDLGPFRGDRSRQARGRALGLGQSDANGTRAWTMAKLVACPRARSSAPIARRALV